MAVLLSAVWEVYRSSFVDIDLFDLRVVPVESAVVVVVVVARVIAVACAFAKTPFAFEVAPIFPRLRIQRCGDHGVVDFVDAAVKILFAPCSGSVDWKHRI